MAINGATVYLIDENTPSAILLNAEIARTYPDVAWLREDEPLLVMEPINVAISKVQYLFFSPKIRKTGVDNKNEIHAKFRDAVESLKKDSSVVLTLPVGLGGNNDLITLLEHVTGFEVGKGMSYFYYPLKADTPRPMLIGTFGGKKDLVLANLLTPGKAKRQMVFSEISSAEYLYAIGILSKFFGMCGTLEICRHIPNERTVNDMSGGDLQDIFLDAMVDGMFDLRALGDAFEVSNPATYMINLSIRGIDNYLKRLVSVIRTTIKSNNIRGNRARVVLCWTIDKHAMRGDYEEIRQDLITKMHDYISDVETYEGTDPYMVSSDKTTVIVPCTKYDFEVAEKIRRDVSLIIVKANPLCQTINRL